MPAGPGPEDSGPPPEGSRRFFFVGVSIYTVSIAHSDTPLYMRQQLKVLQKTNLVLQPPLVLEEQHYSSDAASHGLIPADVVLFAEALQGNNFLFLCKLLLFKQ